MKRVPVRSPVPLVLLLSAILALGFAAPRQATAEPPLASLLEGEAKAEYEAGRLLFQNGDFQGAYLKFQRAYELSDNHNLLWNMMVCRKEQRRYAEVKRLTQLYLREGGDKVSKASRGQAERLLETVASFITPLRVRSEPSGAEVRVDGKAIGTTPLNAEIDIGEHELTIRKPGYEEKSVQFTAAGSEPAQLDVELNRGRARLIVQTNAENATIQIDGKTVGKGEFNGQMAAGEHDITVSAPGYETYTRAVRVAPGGSMTVDARLEEESAIPTWVWIGGSAVLAAGAGWGAYSLFSSGDSGPTYIETTLGTVRLP